MRGMILLILTAGVLGAGTQTRAADGSPAGPPAETRDVLVLLDQGPLHLRFHITIEGRPLKDVKEEYVEKLIDRLDTDGDGRVSQAERRESPLFSAGRRTFQNEFLNSLDDKKSVSREDIERDLARFGGGAPVNYRQDNSAAENDLEVFKVLDADGNGRIEPGEMRTAAARIAELDVDRDECIGFGEFLPVQPQMMDPFAVVQIQQPERDQPQPSYSELLRDMQERLLPTRVIRAYDRNRDGRLSAKEIGWETGRVKVLDRNGDGFLDRDELQRLKESPVDLELSVELVGDGERGPVLKVLASAADRQVPAPRPDLVRLEFGGTTVTFSSRPIDPIETALSGAMQTFNEIDLDANGYIDRPEITDRFRFERYFFEAMDRDGDEKIFAEEMREYVSVVCEPAGTTCQVNVYDTGQGFFQTLDDSGDGRISIRELRSIEESLQEAAGSADANLVPRETGRHYHIEFVRGSYQLFGRSERMIAQGPTFIQRPPVGPIWFQRMDRNSDGDVTWNEFLGPREAFHALDADQDGLIDHKEAEKADEI